MGLQCTPEQSAIVQHVKSTEGLTMVSAVAGAGKTTLLVAIANSITHTNGLYMAYNKAIADESKHRFPSTTHCCTTHSLAYRPTVTTHKLKLGYFTYRNISHPLIYETKCLLVDLINTFCLSEFTSFSDFATSTGINPSLVPIANHYLDLMQSGTIECTHAFYLKYYHMLLADGSLSYEPFDFIMLDECNDLNAVTLEIFKLLPSTRKIMTGDELQNIYIFNNTINGFKIMKPFGTTLPMTQSFRVSSAIAAKIEAFGRKYLDPDMHFRGVEITDPTIRTRAFISRTNGSLVGKMIELNHIGIPYSLVRPAKQIFRVPLLLCGLKHKGFIPDPEYKHLQHDVNHYYDDPTTKSNYKSLFAYLKESHSDDPQIQSALAILLKYGAKAIIDCYSEARKHEHSKSPYTLCSGHSSKG